MEKILRTEELRAMFREVFKKEFGNFCDEISFLSKHDKDRVIYSYMFSAIYCGTFRLTNIDVTEHCKNDIKERYGLSKSKNLIDYLSAVDVRKMSVATYNTTRTLQELKCSHTPTFEEVASLCWNSGYHAGIDEVKTEKSDYDIVKPTPKISADNISKNTDYLISNNMFRPEDFEILENKNPADFILLREYIVDYNYLLQLLKDNQVAEQNFPEIFQSMEEGFYKSSVCQRKNINFINMLKNKNYNLSTNEIAVQRNKISYARQLCERQMKINGGRKKITYGNFCTIFYNAGREGRLYSISKFKTSPEFFSSFAQCYIETKKQNIKKQGK